MNETVEQQDLDMVIGMVFPNATFLVCMRWTRPPTEDKINKSGQWSSAGTITPSTAYVAPGASPQIKHLVSELLNTAKVNAGTDKVLENLLGNIKNIKTGVDLYDQSFDGVLFAGQGHIYRGQPTNDRVHIVSLHEYIAVGNKTDAPLGVINLLFKLKKSYPKSFKTARGCMSAIQCCIESLYSCRDVGVTLFFQRKLDNWGKFEVWEKSIDDQSWEIFKVQNNGEEDSNRDCVQDWDHDQEDEEEGKILIGALPTK